MNRRWIGPTIVVLAIQSIYSWQMLGAPPQQVLSNPPLRQSQQPSMRPLPQGAIKYVDATRGDDQATGSKDSPWKTIQYALMQLAAGDTLCLRGGVYYERVQCSLRNVTIRSYPGEVATIDGGWREFYEHPESAWEPIDAKKGEYRSRRRYGNASHVSGWFADSMIGLAPYRFHEDLVDDHETVDSEPMGERKPFYCGPGILFDYKTGYVHARFQHTHVPGLSNYQGETDPRKLPLVICPLQALPLEISQGYNLRFQDLQFRGSGEKAVVVRESFGISFDNCTFWCGLDGVRLLEASSDFYRCGFYGNIPPWICRDEMFEANTRISKGDFRSNGRSPILGLTKSLLILDADITKFRLGPRGSVAKVAGCEFSDAADGVNVAPGVVFHHNRFERLFGTGISLLTRYPYYRMKDNPTAMVVANHLSRCCIAFGLEPPGGEHEGANNHHLEILRNIVDLRQPIPLQRRTNAHPGIIEYRGSLVVVGSRVRWPESKIMYNTFIMQEPSETSEMELMPFQADRSAIVNNIFLHGRSIGIFGKRISSDLREAYELPPIANDGNWYWTLQGVPNPLNKEIVGDIRQAEKLDQNKDSNPAGLMANSRVADPRLKPNSYELAEDSPARRAGAKITYGLTTAADPYRRLNRGRSDVGALPYGVEMFKTGREYDGELELPW